MSKKKKKSGTNIQKPGRFDKLKTAAAGVDFKMLTRLLAGSLLSCVLFFMGIYTAYYKIVYIAWLVLLGGFVIAYVIIHKGFTEHGVTVDMLPDTMSLEEKTAFVERVAAREKKTKWMLEVIVCLALPVMLDLFKLFVWDRFVGSDS